MQSEGNKMLPHINDLILVTSEDVADTTFQFMSDLVVKIELPMNSDTISYYMNSDTISYYMFRNKNW